MKISYGRWIVGLVSAAFATMSVLGAAETHAAPTTAGVSSVNGQIAAYLSERTDLSPLVAESLPSVNSPTPLYLTADVTASAHAYSIQYWALTHSERINQHASASASADTPLLTIAGRAYSSHNAAVHAITAHVAPWYVSLSSAARSVPLIPGFDAAYNSKTKVLSWQEGDWTIEVHQGSEQEDLDEGKKVIAALDHWALPPFPGILIATGNRASAAIGDVYALAFADGAAVYQINPFYNHTPHASFGLDAPEGDMSPADLVESANSLVPTAAFYQASVATVTVNASPDTLHAGQYSMISGQLVNGQGTGVAYSPFLMSGLPQTPNYVNGTANQAGRFSLRILFPRAGFETISVGDGLVDSQVTVHVLSPARSDPTVTHSPVIGQALHAILGKTTLPLSGPAVVPDRASGYLTATVQALPSTYVVFLIDTSRPLPVNSSAINQNLEKDPMVAQFSVARLATAATLPRSREDLTSLAQYNPLYVRTSKSGAVARTVNLGLGIEAKVRDAAGSKTLLNWREGDWTIQVEGATMHQDVLVATPIVSYLHRNFLPPYPGIVAVRVGTHGARAQVDWLAGHLLSTLGGPSVRNRPLIALAMAAQWRAF